MRLLPSKKRKPFPSTDRGPVLLIPEQRRRFWQSRRNLARGDGPRPRRRTGIRELTDTPAFHANRRFSSKALVQQPGGFEGFIGTRVKPTSTNQTALQRVEGSVTRVDPVLSAAEATALVQCGDDMISLGIEDIVELLLPFLPRAEPIL